MSPILRIALPSIAANITVPLLALVDTAIVGHLGSAVYIGAVAVGGMVFSMIYWIFGFLRMGTGGLTAQACGAGLDGESLRILLRSLGWAAATSLLLIALQVPIADAAFLYASPTPEVEASARTYFSILIWGAPAVLGLYSFVGWFLGMQNARYAMYIALVQNVVNIAASLSFVLLAGMKVEGVALGTLLAQYAGLAMAVGLWLKAYRRRMMAGGLPDKVWEKRALSRFFSVNRDIFLRTLCLVFVTTWFTRAGARQGDLVLAANALLMQFFVLFSYVMDGFAYAGEALGGRYAGAHDAGSFRRMVKSLFTWGTALAAAFTLTYALGGGVLLWLLTNDTAVSDYAAALLPFACAIPAVSMAAFLLDGIFVGTTSTRPMLLAMACACTAFFATAVPLLRHGNEFLWAAFLIYLALRSLVSALLYPGVLRKVSGGGGSEKAGDR